MLAFVREVGDHGNCFVGVLFYEFRYVVVYLWVHLQYWNVSQISLLVVQSVVDVPLYHPNVRPRLRQVLRLHRFQAFRIICEQKYIFVLVFFDFVDFVAGRLGGGDAGVAGEEAGEGFIA